MSMIPRLLTWLRRRLGAEDGVVLLYALGAMFIVAAMTATALYAVTLDTGGTAADTYQKQAYSAAEAGIQRYLYELNTNNTFWTQCVPSGSNWIVNTGASGTPQPVPGSSTEKYLVMLLPATGQNTYTSCSVADPVDSMIQASGNNAGTLRISSTGTAVNSSGATTASRTIVAAIRQQNFLDYAYFTNYETSDPLVQVDDAFASTGDLDTAIEPPDQCGGATGCGGAYSVALNGGTYNGTTYPGATSQCSTYRSAGRENTPFFQNTFYYPGYGNYSDPFYCSNIEFIGSDAVNGPFHSNDSVLMCGSPTFGRSGYHDSIEFGGDKTVYPTGYVEAGGCSGSPTLASGASLTAIDTHLNLPTIGQLQSSADYTESGTTCVNLTSSYVQVATLTVGLSCPTLSAASPLWTNLPWSSFTNGVLYVGNSSSAQCNYTYDVDDPVYTPTSSNIGCGTVFVSGQTQKPLTIAAEQDIVIDGNLTYPTPNSNGGLLGLIATGFIRVYHPVVGGVCTANGAANSSATSINTIDAAMLSLAHSFIVDNYSCGANLGTLNVLGSISQDYRGTVGATTQSGQSGYTKNYVYDPRLQYSEPPHFLAPTNGAYAIAYQTECDTASSCDGTS